MSESPGVLRSELRPGAYADSVVDIQLQHSTRVSIPGLAFQHEPGWYLDLGFDARNVGHTRDAPKTR